MLMNFSAEYFANAGRFCCFTYLIKFSLQFTNFFVALIFQILNFFC